MGNPWVEGSGKELMGRREEFVDSTFTDKLKKIIGDPFDDTILQKAAAAPSST